MKFSKKSLVAILLVSLPLIIYFKFGHLLTIHALKVNKDWLSSYVESNFVVASIVFISLMTLDIALTIPGATTLSFAGGLLFRQPYAALYAYVGYVVGACFSYWLVRTVLADYVRPMLRPNSTTFKKLEAKLKENGFVYVILARYTLIFPYWFVTAAASIVRVPFLTFSLATLLAVIPGAVIYTTAGVALNAILDSLDGDGIRNLTPGDIILRALTSSTDIKWLVGALAMAGLIPLILKMFVLKRKSTGTI
jgi:uncharacterized membrane protein YdjX (TVP38/TMEM64 family)